MTGEELREWMTANRWSVRTFARECGVAPSTVYRWREGKQPMPLMLIFAVQALERSD